MPRPITTATKLLNHPATAEGWAARWREGQKNPHSLWEAETGGSLQAFPPERPKSVLPLLGQKSRINPPDPKSEGHYQATHPVPRQEAGVEVGKGDK